MVTDMNLDIAIKKRSSCRAYKKGKLTKLQIREILSAARHAPSPKNRQPWRFVVLQEKNKDSFLKLIQDSFADEPISYFYQEKLNEFNSEKETYRIMKEADVVILVFNAYPSIEILGKEDTLFDCTNIQAIGAAIQNMILKATELEIGSLWICDIFTSYQQICKKYFDKGQLIAAVAFGYPSDNNTPPKYRKSLDELIMKINNSNSPNLIWVGPRESDIYYCKDLFQGSVTIFGSGQDGNISYCKENNVRIDHNVPECIDDLFWINEIKHLKNRYPNSKILYYNSEYSFKIDNELKKDVICCNSLSLLRMLDDKTTVRKAFSTLIPVVPFQELTYSNKFDLSALFFDVSKLIFQDNYSSGGYGTHVVDINAIDADNFVGKTFMVSPYFEKSISVNVHLIIGNKNVLYFPGSIQIIQEIDHKLIDLGADYIAFQTISTLEKNKLRSHAEKLGKYLQNIGYRGVVGFDFLITKEDILFVEANARFQASTPLLNMALKMNNLPSVQEMHIAAFYDSDLPTQQEIDSILVPYSMISYVEGTWNKPYALINNAEDINEIDMLFKDGFSTYEHIQKNAYLFKMVFNTNCTSITPDYKVNVYENLFDIRDDFFMAIINKEKLETKISLLNQGVKISDKAKKQIEDIGKIRNAVFNAVDLTIFDFLQVNCPKKLKFSDFTPWEIDINKDGKLVLFYYNNEISDVTLDLADIYCDNLIKSDIKFSDVCFWATDRLRIHHTLSCCMKKQGIGCKFCEVPTSDRSISIDDILYVVDFYLEHANTFRHFLIGGGSEPREIEYKSILRVVKHVREKSSKDIYVMSLPPPENLNILKEYYEAGVTEIGFNIELFDQNTALKYMPGKGKITRQEYFKALEEAVKYWGRTGKVRSLIIVGLESENYLLQGIQELCKIGVMPILSVFRPIPGTDTENIVPPSNHFLRNIYRKGTMICNEFSLHLGPECPSCQNNTLSLPF